MTAPTRAAFGPTYHGVTINATHEDTQDLTALGHHPRRLALAAACAYYRDGCAERLEPQPDAPIHVEHSWVLFQAPDGPEDWQFEECEPSTPGAVPVTFVVLGLRDTAWAAWPARCPRCGRWSTTALDVRETLRECRGCGHHFDTRNH